MLIGNKGQSLNTGNGATADAADAAGAPAHSFDVTTMDFEDKVMKASMDKPVIVDFWAPWCGPCKQLMPVLEQAVGKADGKILLAKVNIDENPELAQAMQVQSVPMVFVFFGGQPVTGFQGARPQSEIEELVDKLLAMAAQSAPDALDVPAALEEAAQALAAGEITKAQAVYMHILQEDETNAAAYAGLLRSFVGNGDLEQARHLTEDVPESVKKDSDFTAAVTALELAENAAVTGGDVAHLHAAVQADADDHQARFDLAMALFAAGEKGAAIEELLEIIRRDREWGDDKARKQLLQFFEALGFSDPDAVAGRKKLSAILFS